MEEFKKSMTPTSLSVACLGLGRIGAGIAHNIQVTGCRFIVYNRTPEKMQPFVAAGATAAHSPREAAQADVLITRLMDDRSVLDNMMGEDGMLAGLRPGAIHIGTSTISPNASARLDALHEAQGSHYISAPVVGRPDAAAAGKLITFVAGKAAVIERCRPLLDAYASQVVVLGDNPTSAASMKLVVNFFGASVLELIGEVFVFAEKRGLNPAVLGGILKTMFHHPALPEYVERFAPGTSTTILVSRWMAD
jgi:3-hydroxyisobutyrate dehydrogenase-like beta-hydroxyacid dehydrogenase